LLDFTEVLRLDLEKISFGNKTHLESMEIDCVHHQVLLEFIQQLPELTDELQSFLQTVNDRILLNDRVWIYLFLGEMVSR
jgi:hypothetical protein